jgi:soluble P-type ATPase
MFIVRIGPPYYQLVIDSLSNGIPQQQVFNINKDVESVVDRVKYRPIFGKYYLVIASYVKGKSFWQTVKTLEEKEFIKVIVYTHTKEEFMTMISKAEDTKFDIKVYDSYKASKQDRNVYIIRTLKKLNKDIRLTQSGVDLIRQRLYGYTIEVNGFLQQLAFSDMTQKSISKIIPKKSLLTTNSFGWMMYDNKVSLAEADEFIQRYRYYPMPLVESLKKYTEKLLNIYSYYLKGEFTEVNYDEFIVNHKDLISSQFAAKNILVIFGKISIERLYQIYSMLQSADSQNRMECILILYKCVRLIGGL